MDPLLNLVIHPPPSSTQVFLGSLFSEAFFLYLRQHKVDKVAIITDHCVKELYGLRLKQDLKKRGFSANIFSFKPGELSKNQSVKTKIEEEMLHQGIKRDSYLIGIGGGVVLDMAGFIASTYMRGLSHILIPTTLLAVIDASIGGKTAINTSHGKNLIGTFYHPQMIWVDPDLLVTLPENAWREGGIEIIKHALIADPAMVELLEEEPLFWKDANLLLSLIKRNLRIKASIVSRDPLDLGGRMALNFGHTIGHALERASDYELTHGRAVAFGIILESFLSLIYADLPLISFERIIALIERSGIDLTLSPSIWKKSLLKSLDFDKKIKLNRLRFAFLSDIGFLAKSTHQMALEADSYIVVKLLNWFEHEYKNIEDFKKLSLWQLETPSL